MCPCPPFSSQSSVWRVPAEITSDRVPQFTSNLWTALSTLLGAQHYCLSSASEWHCGRFHRQLKAALRARLTEPDWMDKLPLVLLGIRAAPSVVRLQNLSMARQYAIQENFFNLQHPLLSQQRPIYLHIYVPPWRDCDHRRHLITDDMLHMCP